MKPYQTPTSCHSRKGSLKVQRQPLQVISNCPEYQQCANYLQDKVQGLELRVKNLNSQHADRSATKSKVDIPLSPFMNQKKTCQSNQKIDSQSFYETIINKRLENISKIDHSPKHVKTDQAFIIQDKFSTHSQLSNLSHYQSKLHSNSILRIQQLTKKLRKFKMIKDQNQDECAPSLAKIKCFCQEHCNDCFDFYRCTDLITLKYFIYLLLQEINTLYSQDAIKMADNSLQYQQQIEMLKEQLDLQKSDQLTFQNQLRLQKMVVDTQKLIQDIINALSSKQNNSLLINQVEVLNKQMKDLKDNMSTNQTQNYLSQNTTSFGQQLAKCGFDTHQQHQIMTNESSLINQSNYQTQIRDDRNLSQLSSKSKSPYYRNQKNLIYDYESQNEQNKRLLDEQTIINRQLMENLFKLQTEKQSNEYKVIQLQDEIKQKTKLIKDLEKNVQSENSNTYNNLNQRIIDISKNLDQVLIKNQELTYENNHLREKQDELQKNEQNYYDLQQDFNKQYQQLNAVLKENFNLQKLNQQIESDCKNYQQQILKFQEKCQNQYAHLENQQEIEYMEQQIKELQLQQKEQCKIITLITDEALYLGQVTLYACDILSRQSNEGIPTTLLMLQKDLNAKKSTIQQKMNILEQFGNNLKLQDVLPHNHNQMPDSIDYNKEKLNSETSTLRQKNLSYYDEKSNTVNQNNQQNELMTMLLLQCNIIEKMMEF
ncbi:unnamed protein product [Paramecium pentaurelia]|uniref:Uncharacterized protein n=1 Tax=Paramecium pentaurelia TaxID=43138 RepID=A0A8S1XVG8_9CILI|nr:unnamed protein product [Paramecium pentaurelia]